MPETQENLQDVSNKIVIDSLQAMHTDISALREGVSDNIKELTEAVIKLVKVEEKQTYLTRAYDALVRQHEKALVEHDALETRVDALEKDAPMQKRVTNWTLTLILGIAAGAIYAGFKLLGIV